MNTDEDLVWVCQYCGVHNTVWVDLFIEECRICCRPNRIIITVDSEEMPLIESRLSDE
jgi:hypothetical protein